MKKFYLLLQLLCAYLQSVHAIKLQLNNLKPTMLQLFKMHLPHQNCKLKMSLKWPGNYPGM